MEREYGKELTKVFGARLKRVYELDDAALPASMMQWLERLKTAENELASSSAGVADRAQTSG